MFLLVVIFLFVCKVGIIDDDCSSFSRIRKYCFYEEDTPKNIILKPNEKNPQGGPYVLAGTLPKIVERLTFKDIFPSAIFYVFPSLIDHSIINSFPTNTTYIDHCSLVLGIGI